MKKINKMEKFHGIQINAGEEANEIKEKINQDINNNLNNQNIQTELSNRHQNRANEPECIKKI